MTEEEWLGCNYPEPMLTFLRGCGPGSCANWTGKGRNDRPGWRLP
jgi:hypothetical protein